MSTAPKTVAELIAVAQTLTARLVAYLATLGLTEADRNELVTATEDLVTQVTQLENVKAAYHGQVEAKNESFENTIDTFRRLVMKINASPNITDTIRENLGLKKADGESASTIQLVEVPVLSAESLPGQVNISFKVQQATTSRVCKPTWVKCIVIYGKRKSDSRYQIMGFATRSPYTLYIDGPTDEYSFYGRYQSSNSQMGPASQAIVIAAKGIAEAA